MAESAKWYVAHTYSGYENAVKTAIEKFVANRHLEDMIIDIQIPMEKAKMKEILQGYDSVIRMTAGEREAVPYMILTNQLISTAWFADKDRYREQYETNLRMTRWIIRNFDKLKL